MKKFFGKLLIFLAIILAFDMAYGIIVRNYRRNVSNGMTRIDNIALYETTADILVFGSSRARRHYDSRIIAKALGMPTFNCGYNSMGIEFFYPRLRQILTRYTPKIIIYDVTPLYDYLKSDNKRANILSLKPFFHDTIVGNTIRDMDYLEWIKLHSCTYRYNGELKKYIDDQNSTTTFFDGYAPLNGTLKIDVKPHGEMVEDIGKIRLMEDFIKLCRQHDITLYFVISPYFGNDMGDQSGPLRFISKKYDIPVFDHFNDADYISDSTLYWDVSHFNSKGASRFTTQIMSEIQSVRREESSSGRKRP